MGRLARVITSYLSKLSGSGAQAQHVAVEEFAGDERKAQVFGPCNEDFAPPTGVKTIDFSFGLSRGLLASGCYANEAIAPEATAGERRLYSTNAGGDTVKTEIFLKSDGTILIKNDSVDITVTPGGNIIANATAIQLNGAGDNLTMWGVLNSSMQSLVTALNNHTHGGGVTPDQTFALDITGARADTLQTDG